MSSARSQRDRSCFDPRCPLGPVALGIRQRLMCVHAPQTRKQTHPAPHARPAAPSSPGPRQLRQIRSCSRPTSSGFVSSFLKALVASRTLLLNFVLSCASSCWIALKRSLASPCAPAAATAGTQSHALVTASTRHNTTQLCPTAPFQGPPALPHPSRQPHLQRHASQRVALSPSSHAQLSQLTTSPSGPTCRPLAFSTKTAFSCAAKNSLVTSTSNTWPSHALALKFLNQR